MAIQAISVNGDIQQIDYEGLANKPTIPDLTELTNRVTALESSSTGGNSSLPTITDSDAGKALTVLSDGSIGFNSKLTVEYITNFYNSYINYTMGQSRQLVPAPGQNDDGKTAVIVDHEWALTDFSIVELYTTVISLSSQLSQLEERVAQIASNFSDTQVYVTNDKVSFSGSGVSVVGDKLSINDSAANVTGETLSIA